jgi:glutamate--cysteine ligase
MLSREKNIYLDLLKKKYNKFPETISSESRKIGTELEFHIITKDGSKPNFTFIKTLLNLLLPRLDFQITELDYENNAIKGQKEGDVISYEYGYGIIELSLAPSTELHSIAEKAYYLIEKIQNFLGEYDLSLLPLGINPFPWALEIPYIKNPYYEALHHFFDLFNLKKKHSYVDTNAFICSSQVHLDLSLSELPIFMNSINKISWVKSLLFSNSPYIDNEDNSHCFCFRDILWEDLALATIPSNVQLHKKSFKNPEEVYFNLLQNSIFHVKRGDNFVIFKPLSLEKFLKSNQVEGFMIKNQKTIPIQISPLSSDIFFSRPYNPVVITHRGTVEIRSECQQPFANLMTPLAFHLGFINNLEKIKIYIESLDKQTHPFTPLELRKLSIYHGYEMQKELNFNIKNFIFDLLTLIQEGLSKRGLNEEKYLAPLFFSLDSELSPAGKWIDKKKKGISTYQLVEEICQINYQSQPCGVS